MATQGHVFWGQWKENGNLYMKTWSYAQIASFIYYLFFSLYQCDQRISGFSKRNKVPCFLWPTVYWRNPAIGMVGAERSHTSSIKRTSMHTFHS